VKENLATKKAEEAQKGKEREKRGKNAFNYEWHG
jgi:hypothetical protein